MGKGGDLWDDSALVDAFDRAVSSFKAVHRKNTQATSCGNEKPGGPASAEQEEPISAETTDEKEDRSIDIQHFGSIEIQKQPSEESKTTEQIQETDPGKGMHVSETNTLSSDLGNADRNLSSSQQVAHNELLRRYYELEEQSRNIFQQLQQTNYWDSQASYYASTNQQPYIPAYNATTAQDPHASTAQSSCCYCNCPTVSVSCCSASQPSGSSASVSPYGGCSISVTCDQCPGASTTYPTGSNVMQPLTKLSANDDEVIKAAAKTAEGAFNFMRSAVAGDPASQRKESETGKEGASFGVQPNFDIAGADSDLSVVLNAWFMAGFYTGRYLEKKRKQSNENSQQ